MSSSFAGPFEARPELSANWLNGTNRLSLDALERLIALGNGDPEVRTLIERAFAKAKVATASDFLAQGFFKLCDPQSVRAKGGQTDPGTMQFHLLFPTVARDYIGKTSAEEIFGPKIETIKAKSNIFDLKSDFHQEFAEVLTLEAPVICLQRGLPVISAYETLVHEMTHFTYLSPFQYPDMLDFENEEDYLHKTISQPGDEVDAFIAGIRARIRLVRSRDGIVPAVAEMFNEQGDFISERFKFADFILGGQGSDKYGNPVSGFGYRNNSLRGTYANKVLELYNLELDHRNAFASTLEYVINSEKSARRDAARLDLYNMNIYQGRMNAAVAAKNKSAADDAKRSYEKHKENYNRNVELSKGLSVARDHLSEELRRRDERLYHYRNTAFRNAGIVERSNSP